MKCEKCEGRGLVHHAIADTLVICEPCRGMGTIDFPNSNNINGIAKVIHEVNKQNGFHDEYVPVPQFIALVHEEVSEALRADRKGDKENYREELADIIIRVLDRVALEDINIEYEIFRKIQKNRNRGHKHGKRY